MDPTAWLDDVVINAYISCIRSQKHLDYHQDGKVFLEVTFMSTMFKEAGKKMLNPAAEDDEISVDITLDDVIIQQSKKYLEHDMIFLPINIEDQHRYLAVVNSRKKSIQLKGLSESFHSNQANGESVHGWESLDVHEWEVDEIFFAPLQTDCFSCGLFELKFSELLTGNKLVVSITQNEIKLFRLKLAACLLLWKANVADLEDNNTQKDTGAPHDPSDCFIVENDHQDLKTPQSAILATVIPEYPISIDKRKKDECDDGEFGGLTHEANIYKCPKLGDDGPESRLARMILEIEDIKRNLTSEFWEEFFELEADQNDEQKVHDDSSKEEIINVVPPNAEQFIQNLCMKILLISDPVQLETLWVIRVNPSPLRFSLRELQDSLKLKEPMPTTLFNMGLRMIVCSPQQQQQRDATKLPNNFMDLTFSTEFRWWCSPVHRNDAEVKLEKLAELFSYGPSKQSFSSCCKSIYLPFHGKCNMGSSAMASWNRIDPPLNMDQDAATLRREFLVNLLAFEGNGVWSALPEDIKSCLQGIKNTMS
ncbi:hypothetical protein QOZ80_5BG0437810 [Eleusine coracana subsp. coracana]|nr:hypothetical protein QOZ80_5BG0437810 [Eleusine coracana subsp. coracana]